MKYIFLLFIFIGLGSSFCLAEELIEKTIQVTTEADEGPSARRDLQDQAVLKATNELARDLMGPDRFERNKNFIQNKIAKLSGRYISYVKPGEMEALKPGPGYSMSFIMKISPTSLKTLLQNQGLMNENDTLPVVLPLVSFYDRVQMGTYRWWQPGDISSKRFLLQQARNFEASLRLAFKRQNFHVIEPMNMGAINLLPQVYQNDRVSVDDREFFGKIFQAPLVVDGQIEFLRSPLGSSVFTVSLKLFAVQLSNNRPIADVSRKVDTDSGPFEAVAEKKMRQILDAATQDLANQVFEAWQKGTVGTNILRLTLRGEVPIRQRESLKEKIRNQIPQIKNIKERLISANSLSFEVDSSATPQELGLKLSQLDLGGIKLQPSSSTEKEIVVDIRK